MNFWHRVAHALGVIPWCRELFIDHDYVVSQDRCNGCGATKNILRLYSYPGIDLLQTFPAQGISTGK